ncbi:hypothetical protein ABZ890_43910 [Streptomyces sp. NPDC046984]
MPSSSITLGVDTHADAHVAALHHHCGHTALNTDHRPAAPPLV